MSNYEQKHHEDETDGYKAFLPVARKIKKIDYDSKWRIVPDMSDPLRRFTLERDIAWATLKVKIQMKSTYHRNDYSDNRYFYKPVVVVEGLFASQGNPQSISLDMVVKPRMAKKVIEAINTVVIPKFYQAIETEKKLREESRLKKSLFEHNISKIKGLKVVKSPNHWDNDLRGELSNCPIQISLREQENTVILDGEMTYDDFAKLAEHNGWGK